MCGAKGYGFSAVLVINRVWILTSLVIERVWFLCFSLELNMFLEDAPFQFIITMITRSIKALNNAFNIGLNWKLIIRQA